jgi:hypothetical protein
MRRLLLASALLAALAGCSSTNPGVPDTQEDVPVPHGYGRAPDDEETKSYYEKHENFRNYRVTYLGKGTASDAFAFYQKQLPNDGWVIENATPDARGHGGTLSALKDQERLKVWVKPDNDGEHAWVTVEIGYGK